ncbi:DUF4175 domain-containing protein [Parasulfuritortus cantonensis]|uniref:DUF4175 domain-containing protein n=1 Tax=Parasulfuritortus cantonensis TaxID=2528202 RepID=UPI0014050AAF|nr:DUF4175 domain-containing protein [Parasulfuritortus cantonensis]
MGKAVKRSPLVVTLLASWRAVAFPTEPRRIPYERWLNIGLRSVHLMAVAGCSAGFLYAADLAVWRPYWLLAVFSGLALSLLYIASSGVWLLQLKGWGILLKLLVLAASFVLVAWRAELFFLVVAMSALIAHAPARVRAWPWRGTCK